MADTQQQPSTAVATQTKPEIVRFREQLQQRAGEIRMALPSHISEEKFQRTIITAAQSDPDLLKADRQSLVLACMKAAQDGLLPDKRESAIVVFKENKKLPDNQGWQTKLIATYLPMVYGLRKKILQSGDVVSLEVAVVYRAEVEAGKFLYEVGIEPPLRHRPMLELSEEQTKDSEIVAAYSIATMKDGSKSYEVMRRFEIDRVRETSKTGATKDRHGKARQPSGPWVDWFPEMAKKTVMRRHAKTLPQSGDIIVDVEGAEHEAGISTARVLQTEPDAPRIEQRDDLPPHDAETGEIADEREGQPSGDEGGQAQAQEPEKPKRIRRTRAQIDADNAAAAQAQAEAERPVISTNSDEASGIDESLGADVDDESDADDGEHVDTGEHPAKPKADELKSLFEKAATVIDLKRYYDEAGLDIAAMPEEMAADVEQAYQDARARLGAK